MQISLIYHYSFNILSYFIYSFKVNFLFFLLFYISKADLILLSAGFRIHFFSHIHLKN